MKLFNVNKKFNIIFNTVLFLESYKVSLIFLGCVLLLLLFLPLMYYLAQKYLDSQHKEDIPEYMQVESSDESVEEFIPAHTVKAMKEEKRKTEEQKSKVFTTFLSTERALTPVPKREEKGLDRVYLPLEVHRDRDSSDSSDSIHSFQESIYQTTIGLKLKYIEEENELTAVITYVKDILKYEHGGPKAVKYEVKLFQNATHNKHRYKKKWSSEYVTVAKIVPTTFTFFNINPNLLKTLTLEVRLYGCRKRLIKRSEELLGETFICLEDVNFSNDYGVTLTRSILPVAEKLEK